MCAVKAGCAVGVSLCVCLCVFLIREFCSRLLKFLPENLPRTWFLSLLTVINVFLLETEKTTTHTHDTDGVCECVCVGQPHRGVVIWVRRTASAPQEEARA